MPPAKVSLDEFLLALKSVSKHGDNWQAQCPAHDDARASLSVSVGRNGGIVLKCFAGCSFSQIAHALSFQPAQLCAPKNEFINKRVVKEYDYRDVDGSLRFRVCRFDPKDFRQCRPDPLRPDVWLWNMQGVKKIPYRLNEIAGKPVVYVVEGEKDADALWSVGLPATTNVGGAGKWRDSDSQALANAGIKRVILLPDNDAPGRQHMEQVAKHCKAAGLAILYLPLEGLAPKGDVFDWLRSHSRAELEAIVSSRLYVMPKGVAQAGDNGSIDRDDPGNAARWELTELGAAEAFVHRFASRMRYDHQRSRWLVWNCHHWQPDATLEVERLSGQHIREWRKEAIDLRDKELGDKIETFARSFESRGRFANMLRFAISRPEVLSVGHEWDADPWLLGCPNGILDLRTGLLRAGEQTDHVTLQVGADFETSATCPRWEQFLFDVFDGNEEMMTYIQRALGYSLTGDTKEQVFFLCVGTGSNGKSTFLSTIEYIWNHYAYTTSMATFTISPRGSENDFNLAELDGPRLILASETKTDAHFNETLLKNFTGGERINAQRKHGRPFVYKPVGKIWIAVNHQPSVKDTSTGFWRRMRVLRFPRTFAGSTADLGLMSTLRSEASGILSWAVRGCIDYIQNGIATPFSVLQDVENYKDTEDFLREFISECISTDDSEAEETSNSIYEAYVNYQNKNGVKSQFIPSRKSFGKTFSSRFNSRESNGKRIYKGVRILVSQKVDWYR